MHVLVNVAMSADGKLSTRRREQLEISSTADFERVSRLRSDRDAIVVGVGTVVSDDPHLIVDDPTYIAERREAGRSEQPARVVIDSTLRTPTDARILDDAAETYLITTEQASIESRASYPEDRVTIITAGEGRVDLHRGFAALDRHGHERILVEGGGELIYSLFETGLVDAVSMYIAPMIIGGRDAPTLADGEGFIEAFPRLSLEAVTDMDEGLLIRWSISDR